MSQRIKTEMPGTNFKLRKQRKEPFTWKRVQLHADRDSDEIPAGDFRGEREVERESIEAPIRSTALNYDPPKKKGKGTSLSSVFEKGKIRYRTQQGHVERNRLSL